MHLHVCACLFISLCVVQVVPDEAVLGQVDAAYLRLSLLRSLNRLGVDTLDLVHLHWCGTLLKRTLTHTHRERERERHAHTGAGARTQTPPSPQLHRGPLGHARVRGGS
jgi:aryl-alcohol dehydrogenase-like predicted oxidoreductase